MSKAVNYFEAQRTFTDRDDTTLSLIVSSFIPSVVSSMETRNSRSFWATDADYSRAYQALKRQQWELLMDSTDRLISEIRATRNGVNTPLASQDPLLDPYTLPLSSLSDIAGNLFVNGESAAFILAGIRVLMQQANAGDAESQAELLRIGAIIAGAL